MKLKLTALFLFAGIILFAQNFNIRGYVLNSKNEPVSFASVEVYVADKGVSESSINAGTSADLQGRYQLTVDEGVYNLVISAVGYVTKTVQVTVNRKDVVRNIYLQDDVVNLDEIEVKLKGRDPAYEIIRNAIKAKNNNQYAFTTSESDVYIKAKLRLMNNEELKTHYSSYVKRMKKDSIRRIEREERIEERRSWMGSLFEKDSASTDSIELDTLPQIKGGKKQKFSKEASMNFAEIFAKRYYESGGDVKEIRTGFKVTGEYWSFFYLTTAEAEFDFYNNLIKAPSLTDYPLVTPLNITSSVSYKFSLMESYSENEKYVHRIKIEPRMNQTALFRGEIHITDGEWAIYKVDLTLDDYALNIYDEFRIQQDYSLVNDSIWVVSKQTLTYYIGQSKRVGKTTVVYDNYEFNKDYGKRFFNNALLITTQEAVDKDSSFWKDIRPEPLSEEEQRIINYKDSVYEVTHSQAYLDSIDRVANKFTPSDVLDGYSYYNRSKNIRYFYPSVFGLVNPFSLIGLGGFRSSIWSGIWKRYESEKQVFAWGSLGYGFKNQDLVYGINSYYLHNAKTFTSWEFNLGKSYSMINDDLGMSLEQASPANYYQSENYSMTFSREMFNGFYFRSSTSYGMNKNVKGIENYEWLDSVFVNTTPVEFDPFIQLTQGFSVSYRPFQKYYLEPKRKVVLGSKWPSFYLSYLKGFEGVMGSRYVFDRLTFGFNQKIQLGTLGLSRYNFTASKFLTYNDGTFITQNSFVASDRFFLQHPLNSFSLLDSTLYTRDLFVKGHYIHHFNGAILNKIPLLKFMKLQLALGGSFLYVHEANKLHMEAYTGIEREIRLWGERFKLGVFPVFNVDNTGQLFDYRIKIGVNFYDRSNLEWEY